MLFAFFRGDQMRGWWRTEFVAIGVREWDRKWGSLVCALESFFFLCVYWPSPVQETGSTRRYYLDDGFFSWMNGEIVFTSMNEVLFYKIFYIHITYVGYKKKNLEHMLVIEIESDQPPCILLIWIGDQQKTTIAPAPIKNRPLLLFHRNVEHMFETEQPPPNLGWCLHINFFKSPGLVQSTNKTVIVRTTIITPTKNCIYMLILLQN